MHHVTVGTTVEALLPAKDLEVHGAVYSDIVIKNDWVIRTRIRLLESLMGPNINAIPFVDKPSLFAWKLARLSFDTCLSLILDILV